MSKKETIYIFLIFSLTLYKIYGAMSIRVNGGDCNIFLCDIHDDKTQRKGEENIVNTCINLERKSMGNVNR